MSEPPGPLVAHTSGWWSRPSALSCPGGSQNTKGCGQTHWFLHQERRKLGYWPRGPCLHPTPRASPTTDPQPSSKPLLASASVSWIYCEFEKEKHVYSHLEQLPEAPLRLAQELLPRCLPSPAARHLFLEPCPDTLTTDHVSLQQASLRSISRPTRSRDGRSPGGQRGAPAVCKEGRPRGGCSPRPEPSVPGAGGLAPPRLLVTELPQTGENPGKAEQWLLLPPPLPAPRPRATPPPTPPWETGEDLGTLSTSHQV